MGTVSPPATMITPSLFILLLTSTLAVRRPCSGRYVRFDTEPESDRSIFGVRGLVCSGEQRQCAELSRRKDEVYTQISSLLNLAAIDRVYESHKCYGKCLGHTCLGICSGEHQHHDSVDPIMIRALETLGPAGLEPGGIF